MLTRSQLTQLKQTPLDEAPNKVRRARELAQETQIDLAEAVGWPQTYVSRVERGDYSRLPLENARKLAKHFGCHCEDLFPEVEALSA